MDRRDFAGDRGGEIERRLFGLDFEHRLLQYDDVAHFDEDLQDVCFLDVFTEIGEQEIDGGRGVRHKARYRSIAWASSRASSMPSSARARSSTSPSIWPQSCSAASADQTTCSASVLEEAAQVFAGAAAAEAVGAQRGERAGQPLRDLVRERGEVVAGGDDRRGEAGQLDGDERAARLFERVQAVPALLPLRVAAQLGVRGDGPDIRGDAVVVAEHELGAAHLVEDRAGAEQAHGGVVAVARGGELVHAAQDALAHRFAVGHRGLAVGLVLDGDVEEDVLVALVHAADALLDDHGDLVGVGGVVGDEVGDGGGENVAVSVLVLEAFAVERGAAGGRADQGSRGRGSRPRRRRDRRSAEGRTWSRR